MQVNIEEIVIKKRIRKNLGDLNILAESLKKHGLMNPITLTTSKELIAGERRLQAAKLLGWTEIEAVLLDEDDCTDVSKLEMEIEENIQRKSLQSDELTDAYLRLEKLRNPGFFRRIWNAIVNFFKRLFGIK